MPAGSKLPGLIATIDAHSHEVTDLHAYLRLNAESGKKEAWILSASVDGTLRRWKWEEVVSGRAGKVDGAVVEVKEEEESLLTAEEEAELEALMADD